MNNYKNVFSEVYNLAMSKAHSLFVALDKENVTAVILQDRTYWTEQNTYYEGFTAKQEKQLDKITRDNFGAEYLYN